MEVSLAHAPKRISIIGAGDVGATLGRLLAASGICSVAQILNQTAASASAAAAFIGAGTPIGDMRALDLSSVDILMITAPDDAIAGIAQEVAALCTDRASGKLTAFHCSGATPSAALAPLRRLNASIASVHPIKTFSDPETASATFAGTYCGVEGDAAASAELKQLFAAIGAKVIDINSDLKPLYHVATVFACNYVFTLIEAAFRCFEAAGMERQAAATAVQPIMLETVRNALSLGPASALSGPIARGDHQLVRLEIDALGPLDDQLAQLYCQLAVSTLDLAQAKGSAAADDLAQIRNAALAALRKR